MTRPSDRGMAVLVALLALSLLSALAVLMLATSSSEVLIAGAFRDQRAGVYAADAVVARVLDEVASTADWTALVSGARSASLTDGPPSGTRSLADGATIDLQQVTNMANCQKPTSCTVTELTTVSERRPWGIANPHWQLYAYGPLGTMLPTGTKAPPWYAVLFLADDPLENPDALAMRAEAFGPRNAHTTVELLAARPAGSTDYNDGPVPVNIVSWREVR